jgi:ubiquinone/menaquinone biosynthesis C-methylase UbiE
VKVCARLLLRLNRIFPRPIDYEGDTAEAYSRWENKFGRLMFERYFTGRVDITGKRVLDVGCGTGGKVVFYSTLSPERLSAVDLLESNVARAKAYATSSGAAMAGGFAVSDAAALPFAEDSFDIITTTDTFEHFAEPLETLRELARVLRPGGTIVFYFTPHYSPLGSHLYDVIHLPWCHLLVQDRVLFEAIEMELERRAVAGGSDDPHADAETGTAEMRESYYRDLNKMTVRRFLRLVGEVPDIDLVWMHRKPLKTRLLTPLTRIPPFDELTTVLAIGIIRKRS